MNTIILQRTLRPHHGNPSPSEQRQSAVIFVVALIMLFLWWKYRNRFSLLRDWIRNRSRKKFSELPARQKEILLQKAYCISCGLTGKIDSPTDNIVNGEHVVIGKCSRCGAVITIRH